MAEPQRAVGSRREFSAALDERQLTLHFQPVVELRTAQVRGAEALLRWDHPAHGMLTAAAFLPGFEDAPVMNDVTRFVLQEACRLVATTAPPSWSVSVNITTADAGRDALVDEVAAALDLSGLAPDRLVLEVTETGLLTSPADSGRVLGRLRESGVTVALDDFGTGYSSLRLLRELPISELKVDALFVREMERNPGDAAIVSNVISLADAFGASVVAEGVEQRSQAAMLQRLGCGYAQGYLWSRPAPIEQAIGLEPTQHLAGDDTPSQEVIDRVRALVAEGASNNSIAAALNAAGLRTADGRRWHTRSVASLREDLDPN